MKTFKTFFAAIILAVSVSTISAQTAKIDKVWTEQDATQNGQKGMIIHTNFSVQNMMNKSGRVTSWFYDNNNNPLYGSGKYATGSGGLATGIEFTPNYDKTRFSDFKIFLPYDELKKAVGGASGKYNLKFDVGVNDHNSETIAISDYISFTYTIGKNENNNPANENIVMQEIIGGADYYDSRNPKIETIKGQVLKDITSDKIGAISASNLYEFRTEDGSIIKVSFKNRLPSANGNYQVTGSFQTAYLNGVMSSGGSVFMVTSYKKL